MRSPRSAHTMPARTSTSKTDKPPDSELSQRTAYNDASSNVDPQKPQGHRAGLPHARTPHRLDAQMSPVVARIIRAERERRHLSRQQLAEATFVPIEEIVTIEDHGVIGSLARLRRLAREFELDFDALRRGQNEPSREPAVFFRHKSAQNFSGGGPQLLASQLRIGNALVAVNEILERGPGLRSKFHPEPAGIKRPYQQGIDAAQRVRKELQTPKNPLRDLQGLLEEDFSTPVTVCRLGSSTIEAATVKDPRQGSCVVVINSDAGVFRPSSTVFRRLLAHELAHVLLDLDESTPDFILDIHPEGHSPRLSEAGHPPIEQRANAFAAELLIPTAGLHELLGTPSHSGSLESGRRYVEDVEQEFIAPRELTIRHLFNRDYINVDVHDSLLKSGPPSTPVPEIPWRPLVNGFPERLLERMREAHDRYLITGGGVRELLGLDPGDLLPWE